MQGQSDGKDFMHPQSAPAFNRQKLRFLKIYILDSSKVRAYNARS